MNFAALTANIVGWPILQLSIARASLYLPGKYLSSNRPPSSLQLLEAGFYRRVLRIRRWKHLLPDGASWIGGSFSKRNLASHDAGYLLRFAEEAQRGQIAHWCMLACFPIFYLWNPPWASAVMTFYAFAVNLPFILVQRYNRITIMRSLEKHKLVDSAIRP